jgi:hypothetical protein
VFFVLVVISFSIISPITQTLPLQTNENDLSSTNKNLNNQESSYSPQKRSKLTAEEENIDSFNVNPKSGRWNVSETGNSSDTIINSNLRLVTTEDTEGELSQYFMRRELQKTDGNFEYRYKTNLTNQRIIDTDYFTINGDALDFNDSSEFFTTVVGDFDTFNDGTNESWDPIGGSTTINNYANEYLNVSRTSSDFRVQIDRSGLGINGTKYKWLTIEFNTTRDLARVDVTDGTNNVCADITTYARGIMHSWSCNLDDDPDWGASENRLIVQFEFNNTGVGDFVLVNMINLYENEGGDKEGFAGLTGEYQEIEFGYYTGIVASGTHDNVSTATSYTIDPDIYFNFEMRIKASEAVNYSLYAHEVSGNNYSISNEFSLTKDTWETRTLNLSQDATYPTLTSVDYFYLYIVDESGNLEGDEQIFIDYLIVQKEEIDATEQDFVIGFWDETNQVSYANITHHFFNATTFRWEIELYDNNQNIASYYYSDNQTETDAGYAAVDTEVFVDALNSITTEWSTGGSNPYLDAVDNTNFITVDGWNELFVDGWTNTSNQWNENGVTPYLDIVDTTNNITTQNSSFLESWFTFSDTAISYTTDFTTELAIYVLEGDGNDDLQWSIDTNGDNSSEYNGVIQNPTSGWYITSVGLSTKTEINNARLALTKLVSGTSNNITVDSAKFNIFHDELIHRWFTFANISSNHVDDFTTELAIYVLEGDGNDDLQWSIDTNGDNFAECQGILVNPTSGWYEITLASNCLDTQTKINNARLALIYKVNSIAYDIKIDAAKLLITHESTIDSSSCFNAYCRVKVNYNTYESEFSFEMKTDNADRIFLADWTDDFITFNPNPAMFQIEVSPILFVANTVTYFGKLETWIDFITAPFEKRDWIQTNRPTDTDFLHDSPLASNVQDDLLDSSTWELVVPLLDAFSGNLAIEQTTLTGNPVADVGQFGNLTFKVYTVDGSTGTRNEAVEFQLSYNLPIAFGPSRAIHAIVETEETEIYNSNNIVATVDNNFGFSCVNHQDRSLIICDWIFSSALTGETIVMGNGTFTADNPYSQEFIFEIDHNYNITGDGLLDLKLENFDFITADLWQGLSATWDVISKAGAAGLPLDPLSTALLFIADTFKPILNAIKGAIDGLVNTLSPLFDGIVNALQPIWNVLSTGLDALGQWLSDILNKLAEIAVLFVEALLDFLSDFVDAITALGSLFLDNLLDLLPWGIGDWIRTFANIDITGVVTELFDLIAFLLSLTQFGVIAIALGLTAYMFFIPFANDRDINDNVGIMIHNAMHLHGWDWTTGLGNITIPIRINMFIIWVILIALLGWISYILPFSLW